jgi:Ser-tRNA(Ala) deacylase AlaX
MTTRYFWIDPYCRRIDTHVARVSFNTVWLRETVFYAESGGQESDVGTIGGIPVVSAAIMDGDIAYEMPEGHGLVAEQNVEVVIDWTRRYALMRLHFAAEVVLEMAMRKFGLKNKIGAHIGPSKARIDFAHDASVAPLLEPLLLASQELIASDHPIVSGWEEGAVDRRFWQVQGFAKVPCGGTHLKRTSEVGRIVLARRNIGRGKERIEIYLDE